MTLHERDIFFELLRAALWERQPELSVFSGEWEWNNLLRSFREHSLLGVVAHTILDLPEELLPDSKDKKAILSFMANLIRTHQQLNTAIGVTFRALEDAGCHPILLKGAGLASLYPTHCIRSCGDVDIYVGKEGIDIAKKVMNAMATAEEVTRAEDWGHHYQISIGGIIYEIHRHPGLAGNLIYNKRYQSLSREWLGPDATTSVELQSPVGLTSVTTLCGAFNIWYNFNHLIYHYQTSGLGLRQFCDWLVILRNTNLSLQTNVLSERLKAVGLYRSWQILSGILVHQLGCPSSSVPFYDERMAKKSQGEVLEMIVEGRNFHFAGRDEAYLQMPRGLRRMLFGVWSSVRNSGPMTVISPIYPMVTILRSIGLGIRCLIERLTLISC